MSLSLGAAAEMMLLSLPGWFATKIFHPNVAPSTGEICVSTLKKDWKKEYGVGHIVSLPRQLCLFGTFAQVDNPSIRPLPQLITVKW